MENIIIKLNIRNELKLMCIVTDIVSNVNLVNGGKYTGADWTCRPTAPRAVGPWHNHAFFMNLYVVKHI